jgi:hypothetical protein
MSKEKFLRLQKDGRLNSFYGDLSYSYTEKEKDKFLFLLKKVGSPWHWDNISKYKDNDYLEYKMGSVSTQLFYLFDNLKTIGYLLTTEPCGQELKKLSTNTDLSNKKAIEIENIGLFPNQAGKSRGIRLFSMIMNDLFKEHDYVYLSMSSTNHPNLYDFYTKKLCMDHIGTTYAPDPRSETPQKQAA